MRTTRKRSGGYRKNNSWIKKNQNLVPLQNTNIRRHSISEIIPEQIHTQTVTPQKVNWYSASNKNVIKTNVAQVPTSEHISLARSPVSSVSSSVASDFTLPSRRSSFSDIEFAKETRPVLNTFQTEKSYTNIAPVVSGLSEGKTFTPETRVPQNGNYSYVPGQFGNFSQNKQKNSFLTRTRKTFFPNKPVRTARRKNMRK
jgi:hypothetical protein